MPVEENKFTTSQIAPKYGWIFKNTPNKWQKDFNPDVREITDAMNEVAKKALGIPQGVFEIRSTLAPLYVEKTYQVKLTSDQMGILNQQKATGYSDDEVDNNRIEFLKQNLIEANKAYAVTDLDNKLGEWEARRSRIYSNEIDSFRHVLQAAYFTMNYNENIARVASYGHEVQSLKGATAEDTLKEFLHTPDVVKDHNQDFWNNEIGYAIAQYALEKHYTLEQVVNLIRPYYFEDINDPKTYGDMFTKDYKFGSDLISVDKNKGYDIENKVIYHGEDLLNPITADIYNHPELFPSTWDEFANIRQHVSKTIDPIFAVVKEQESSFYKIKKGDTLWDIAQKYGCTVEDLLKANPWLFEKNRVSKDHTYVLIHPAEIISIPLNIIYVEQNKQISQISVQYNSSQKFNDPLTFDLDSDGIETINLNDSQVYFDLDNDAFKERTGWVSKDDGILFIDENNNNIVDDINELFGNTSINGFEEIKLSDTNNDGKIDVNDANFSKMKIWQDLNENGISEAGELKSLTELGIKSINLNYQPVKAA